MRTALLSLLLVLTLAPALWAQEPTEVTVTFRNGRRLEGELVSFLEGQYRIKTAGGVVVVGADRVARVELRLAPAEVCAAEEAANERALNAAQAELPRGLYAVIARGQLLGSRPTLEEARQLAERLAPDAVHCLVFRAGESIPREVALGTRSPLSVGATLLDALGGEVQVVEGKPSELRFSTATGDLRFRARGGQITLPLLVGPADGRLELARLQVTRGYAAALSVSHELALEAGLFRHALPGRVKLRISENEHVLARAVRVRVAMGGLDLDREVIAHVLPPAPKESPDTIDLEAQDAPLRDVVAQLAAKAKRTILVDPRVQESVSIQLKQISWRDALAVLAKMVRCEVEDRGQGVLVLTQPPTVTIHFQDASVRTVLQLLAAYSGKNVVIGADVKGKVSVDFKEVDWLVALRQLVKQIGAQFLYQDDVVRVQMKPADPKELERTTPWLPSFPEGPSPRRVSLEAKDLDLRVAVASLAKQAGQRLSVEPGVKAKVTVQIQDRPWPEALQALARLSRCTLETLPPSEGEARTGFCLTQPPRVTVQFTDANVRTVIQLIGAYSGKQIQLAPEVTGTLSLDLKDVDWRIALREVARSVGARMELTQEGARITPKPKQQGR